MIKYFQTKVDLRSRQSMIDYLSNHPAHYDGAAFSGIPTLANNVKIRNLPLTLNQRDLAYEFFDADPFEWQLLAGNLMADFSDQNGVNVDFAGRSSGWIECEFKNRSPISLSYADVEDTPTSDIRDMCKLSIAFDRLCDELLDLFIDCIQLWDEDRKANQAEEQLEVLALAEPPFPLAV